MRLLAALVALGLPLRSAHAAACCGGVNSTDAFTLPKYNRATLGVALDYEKDLALRDAQGLSSGAGSWDSQDVTLAVGGVARLGPNLQAGLTVPTVARSVRVADDRGLSTGFGDVGLNGRWEIHDDDKCYLNPVGAWSPELLEPSVHALVRATLPTGRWEPTPGDVTGASVTGRGYASLDAGMDLSKMWGVLAGDINGTVGWMSPMPSLVGGRPALRLAASASLMAFYRYKSFVSLSASHREEVGLEGARVATTTVGLSVVHHDLERDHRMILGLGAIGLPPARSTPVGFQAGLSWARVF